jgi:hypothetical protein
MNIRDLRAKDQRGTIRSATDTLSALAILSRVSSVRLRRLDAGNIGITVDTRRQY